MILVCTFTHPHKTITWGCVGVFDEYLHWPCVSVKIYIYTLQQDKSKCKKIECVTVNDLHLHEVYTPYIWLLTLTCTSLVETRLMACYNKCCVCMWFRYTCWGCIQGNYWVGVFYWMFLGDHTSYQYQYQTNWLLGTLIK
jgi:hypothetical protein